MTAPVQGKNKFVYGLNNGTSAATIVGLAAGALAIGYDAHISSQASNVIFTQNIVLDTSALLGSAALLRGSASYLADKFERVANTTKKGFVIGMIPLAFAAVAHQAQDAEDNHNVAVLNTSVSLG